MKRRTLISLLIVLVFAFSQAPAQDNGFYDEFKEYAEDELGEVAKPIVEAFGIGVSGGLYHTADVHKVLGFDVGMRAMMVIIPEGKSDILDSADVTFFPVPVFQASLGLSLDAEIMLRGFSVTFEDETISLFGAGLKKNFKPLIPVPGFPDVAAMVAYHRFTAGDLITSNHFSFDVMVSKNFLLITPYAGFGIDATRMTFEYDYVYEDPGPPPVTLEDEIKSTIKATTTRLTLGVQLSPIPFVKVFADYNISKYSEVTAGVAVSFR